MSRSSVIQALVELWWTAGDVELDPHVEAVLGLLVADTRSTDGRGRTMLGRANAERDVFVVAFEGRGDR